MRISVWALSVWLCTGGAAWADTIQFTLDPPLEKELRQVSVLTYVVTGDDPAAEPLRTWQTRLEGQVVVTEERGQRWLTLRRPERSWDSLRFAFDEQGQFVQMEYSLRATSGLPPDGKSPGDRLLAKGQLMWQGLYGNFWGGLVGRQVDVGDSWTAPVPGQVLITLPSLPPSLDGRWTYLGRETPSPESRVRVRYEVATDAVPVEDEKDKSSLRWLLRVAPELAEQTWSSIAVHKEGELLIDPTLRLIGSQWTDRTEYILNADAPASEPLHIQATLVTTWSE